MEFLAAIGSGIIAIIGVTWVSATWLSKQFTDLRKVIQTTSDKLEKFIIDKIEYHERHDDARFHELQNQMWELRLEQALKDRDIDQNTLKHRPIRTQIPSREKP